MAKQNCWEYKQCGRCLGGEKGDEMGVCPASTEMRADGIHGGINGGRVCWLIAGTLCGGKVQANISQKSCCFECDFYKKVEAEEGEDFMFSGDVIRKITGSCVGDKCGLIET